MNIKKIHQIYLVMKKIMDLKNERKQYRFYIESVWNSDAKFSKDDKLRVDRLDDIHKQIIEFELLDPKLKKERIGYSVCGYDLKHGYFRNKYSISETLKDAQIIFDKLKSDPNWRIPTLIVKETFCRKGSPAMVDFDIDGIDNLGFSDYQMLIKKNKMGNTEYRWKDIIKKCDSRFTY